MKHLDTFQSIAKYIFDNCKDGESQSFSIDGIATQCSTTPRLVSMVINDLQDRGCIKLSMTSKSSTVYPRLEFEFFMARGGYWDIWNHQNLLNEKLKLEVELLKKDLKK